MFNWIFNLIWGDRTFGGVRSSQWPTTKRKFALIEPKICRITNCKSKIVSLHHKIPFHAQPDLENDLKNLVWLCDGLLTKNHHLHIGHLGNYQSINSEVDSWIEKISCRPKWIVDKWVYPDKAENRP